MSFNRNTNDSDICISITETQMILLERETSHTSIHNMIKYVSQMSVPGAAHVEPAFTVKQYRDLYTALSMLIGTPICPSVERIYSLGLSLHSSEQAAVM